MVLHCTFIKYQILLVEFCLNTFITSLFYIIFLYNSYNLFVFVICNKIRNKTALSLYCVRSTRTNIKHKSTRTNMDVSHASANVILHKHTNNIHRPWKIHASLHTNHTHTTDDLHIWEGSLGQVITGGTVNQSCDVVRCVLFLSVSVFQIYSHWWGEDSASTTHPPSLLTSAPHMRQGTQQRSLLCAYVNNFFSISIHNYFLSAISTTLFYRNSRLFYSYYNIY